MNVAPLALILTLLLSCCFVPNVTGTAVPSSSPTKAPTVAPTTATPSSASPTLGANQTASPTTAAPTTPAPTIAVQNAPVSPLCTSARQFTRHHFEIFLGGNPCTNAADLARVQDLAGKTSGALQAAYQAEAARLTALPAKWAEQSYVIQSGECCSIYAAGAAPRLYEFCWTGEDVTLNLTQPSGNILVSGTSYIAETCFVGTQCEADCYELDWAKDFGERISVKVVAWTFKFDFNTQASVAMSIVLIILLVGILLLGAYFIIYAVLTKNER